MCHSAYFLGFSFKSLSVGAVSHPKLYVRLKNAWNLTTVYLIFAWLGFWLSLITIKNYKKYVDIDILNFFNIF